VLSEDFIDHTILSLKFMHIFTDDQRIFCPVFAFSFPSY